MILEHAPWFLFAWVFCNQAGIPVPVIPVLVGAGALAGNGHLGMAVIVGIAVGASLAADLTWYGLGRWRGARALKILGRLAPTARMLVRRAQHVFRAHIGPFQIAARFLPELNAIASGLSGATRTSIIRFLCYGAASALTWAGGWMGLARRHRLIRMFRQAPVFLAISRPSWGKGDHVAHAREVVHLWPRHAIRIGGDR